MEIHLLMFMYGISIYGIFKLVSDWAISRKKYLPGTTGYQKIVENTIIQHLFGNQLKKCKAIQINGHLFGPEMGRYMEHIPSFACDVFLVPNMYFSS
jgi:hypothetical protein